MCLALLAPSSVMPMYLMSVYHYPPRYASMSALLITLSVLVALAAQHVLLAAYGASLQAPLAPPTPPALSTAL